MLNRVLLIDPLPFTTTDTAHPTVIMPAADALPFLCEELIARAATGILIPNAHHAARAVEHLPDALRRRVQVVDIDDAFQKKQALLAPAESEFELEITLAVRGRGPYSEVHTAVAKINAGMLDFFLAMEHEAQLDLDVPGLRAACQRIRGASRDPELRTNMASFEGLLATYTQQEAGSLLLRSTARPDLIALFDELVEDAAYLRFARNASRYGFRRKWQRALQLSRRKALQVAESRTGRHLFQLGLRILQLSGYFPEIELESIADLLRKDFMPPIISLRREVRSAWQNWNRSGRMGG